MILHKHTHSSDIKLFCGALSKTFTMNEEKKKKTAVTIATIKRDSTRQFYHYEMQQIRLNYCRDYGSMCRM